MAGNNSSAASYIDSLTAESRMADIIPEIGKREKKNVMAGNNSSAASYFDSNAIVYQSTCVG